MDLKFVSEGHYTDGVNEYMSIWSYKIEKGINSNNTQQNYIDAKAIICSDKHWVSFNQSDLFKKGWVYCITCLNDYFNK